MRIVNNKGSIQFVDTSKWLQTSNNLFNKNTSGNVAVGLQPSATPNARFVISNGGSASLPALKLQYPFSGEITDSILTWNPSDSTVRKIAPGVLSNSANWLTIGNSAMNPAVNFLGTSDAQPLVVKTNNTEALRINSTQDIGIGTPFPNAKLELNSGTIDASGLRFTQLNASSLSAIAYNKKTLTVNATGDVGLTTIPASQVIVNFSVSPDPNAGATVFLPDSQRNGNVLYVSTINNSLWTWNGTAYVTQAGSSGYTIVPIALTAGSKATILYGQACTVTGMFSCDITLQATSNIGPGDAFVSFQILNPAYTMTKSTGIADNGSLFTINIHFETGELICGTDIPDNISNGTIMHIRLVVQY